MTTDTITVIISSLVMIFSIITFIWKTNQQRKKDIESLFEKKADKDFVNGKFLNHFQLIQQTGFDLKNHDEKNKIQFHAQEKQLDNVADKIEETRMELGRKIDKVQDVIINLINLKK